MSLKIYHYLYRLALGLLFAASLTAIEASPAKAREGVADSAPGHIVVFHDSADVDSDSRSLAGGYGLQVAMMYRHALKGMAAYIPPGLLKRLEQDPRVAYIEPVQIMHLHAQTLPTGINRINTELNATADIDNFDNGLDVDIAIIDTGVDLDHPDLNVWRYVYCYPRNFFRGVCNENDARADDSHGHGTHVAGIAAARDNNTGVVGVAPGARIWGIRVMQQDGSLTSLELIAALDYVAANASQIEVANISLGFVGSSNALDQALASTVAAGVTIVTSAGNEALDVSQVVPAGHPDVITVSALADFDGEPGGLLNQSFNYTQPNPDCTENQDDSFACFSNFGTGIDIMAPGTKIKSTYLNGGSATLHGTSMSSPHVAGAAAIYLINHPGASPATVRAALIASGDPAPCDTPGGYCTDDPDHVYEPMVLLAPFPNLDDEDNDGVPDGTDNCPAMSNPGQSDVDGDGLGDVCDPLTDSDDDGVADEMDNCPSSANANQSDTDDDGSGDVCDPDDDNDGVPDSSDNCRLIANSGQENLDGDALGNACDPDDDNDGLSDSAEIANGTNPLKADSDSDGAADNVDNCPVIANPGQQDTDGDSIGDACDPLTDSDSDGIADNLDNCPTDANSGQKDTDADGQGDACDVDHDNDGLTNEAEINTYGTDPADADTDNDGLSDGYEITEGFNPLDNTDCPGWICIKKTRWGWRQGIGL